MTDKKTLANLVSQSKSIEAVSITPTDDVRTKTKDVDSAIKRLTRSNKSKTTYIVVMN